MDTLWLSLAQFLFRAAMGVAFAMSLTSPRLVTSGFYRVHLWVLLGFATLASLVVYSLGGDFPSRGVAFPGPLLATSVGLAITSYVGAVIWMYENRSAGRAALVLVTLLAAAAAWLGQPLPRGLGDSGAFLAGGDVLTGGLLSGGVLTAMFLGHWYLNTPTMQLRPLRMLVVVCAVVAGLRLAVSGLGLGLMLAHENVSQYTVYLLALRWLAGIILPLVLLMLTWQTLRIPNTQSATGILYAGVILVFIGELTSQLLSGEVGFPV